MSKLDILIVTVPGTTSQVIPAAPSVLKAAVVAAGFACQTRDYNILFYHQPEQDLESYFLTGIVEGDNDVRAGRLIEQWADEVVEMNPKYLGISVFTYQNRVATELFCRHIRAKSDIKIVLGGAGLSNGIQSSFGIDMLNRGLTDYYVKGDGEQSLVELLRGNDIIDGINREDFVPVKTLDNMLYPDFSDYDFDLYNPKQLPITGSRGCVRNCSFCDVHVHSKYRYRSGEFVADEMIALAKQYGLSDFYFTDSLINGNLKEFKIMCTKLAEYNSTAQKPITWGGFFIIRAPNQVFDGYWELVSQSGGCRLDLGVETGSDSVRLHMNKKFDNVGLDYTMEMLEKYSITCNFLIIVGYPTETEQDFQDTLDMFTRYQPMANRIIENVSLGSTLGILPGTPLHQLAEEYNIELDRHENNWIAHDNPTLTIEERLRRVQRLKDHLNNLGYVFGNDNNGDNGDSMLDILESSVEVFNKRNKIKKIIRIKNESRASTQHI